MVDSVYCSVTTRYNRLLLNSALVSGMDLSSQWWKSVSIFLPFHQTWLETIFVTTSTEFEIKFWSCKVPAWAYWSDSIPGWPHHEAAGNGRGTGLWWDCLQGCLPSGQMWWWLSAVGQAFGLGGEGLDTILTFSMQLIDHCKWCFSSNIFSL